MKMKSIWGVSPSGPSAITEDKSGGQELIDHANLFYEENEDAQINMNYLEFLEDRVFLSYFLIYFCNF